MEFLLSSLQFCQTKSSEYHYKIVIQSFDDHLLCIITVYEASRRYDSYDIMIFKILGMPLFLFHLTTMQVKILKAKSTYLKLFPRKSYVQVKLHFTSIQTLEQLQLTKQFVHGP